MLQVKTRRYSAIVHTNKSIPETASVEQAKQHLPVYSAVAIAFVGLIDEEVFCNAFFKANFETLWAFMFKLVSRSIRRDSDQQFHRSRLQIEVSNKK